MSASQQGSSTVCNHGNHKDVALTIIGSVGILYTCHTHARKNPLLMIKVWENSHNSSSRVRWDFATVFCCSKKKLLMEAYLFLVELLFTFKQLLSPLLLAEEKLHWSCSNFIVLLKGNLTCLLYACLLSSSRLTLPFSIQQSSVYEPGASATAT